MKFVHPKCGDHMYSDRGAKDYEGLGLDLEATIGLADENIFLDISAKEARQRLLAKTRDDWESVRINTLIDQLLPLHDSLTVGKIIIADEFLQTLDVVGNALRASGIAFLEFNGYMTTKERDEVRKRFNDPNDPVKVMLATIQCFGLGLTLVQATHVFIFTPKWNPAADAQAIARMNRIGQNRGAVVWTYDPPIPSKATC